MIKNKLKLISSLVSISVLLAYTSNSVSAATSGNFIVDNDEPNSSNYSNYSGSMYSYTGNWGTKLGNGYKGDSRLRQSTDSKNYEWVWYGSISSSTKLKWSAGVYLANNAFTDPNAHYEVLKNSNIYIPVCSFSLNQNTAPNGFSYFNGTATCAVTNSSIRPTFAFVKNSGQSNVGTGADAFHFSCSYGSFK